MSVPDGPVPACYHREPVHKPFCSLQLAVPVRLFAGLRSGLLSGRLSGAILSLAVASACAPKTDSVQTPAAAATAITWEQKLGWMMRLEDQRILRDPNPAPPTILRPATSRVPALVAPAPPSDLIRLLQDSEGRTRRRAALAVGRVGLREGVEPLAALLNDPETEVRQMAAFAIGLTGDASGRAPLLQSLSDASPIVQGRAAEALGQIGDKADAGAISGMVIAHIKAGALASIDPDDISYPLAPPVEAVRLGLYALARLSSYESIASVVLDAGGQPVSRWWPVAYTLQRANDPRFASALTTLVSTPGRYTAAFAVRGLAATKSPQAAATLRPILQQRQLHPAVVIQAIRGLASLADTASVPLLTPLVADPAADPALRLEAMTAFSTLATADSTELLIDLLLDPAPPIRGLAMRTLARVDPETFMVSLASLDPDRDWTVRVATATALGSIPADRSMALLSRLLEDRDPRVVPAAITALARLEGTEVEALLVARLRAPDFVVRATAAGVLAEKKVAAAVPALSAAYQEALNDTTYVARAAILAALHRLSPDAARPLLQTALLDREWAVRFRASTLLREQGVADSERAIRPAPTRRAPDDPAWAGLVTPRFSPQAIIETDKGTIEIELAILDAPLTVDNFVTLARAGFFNGVPIHRVVPDFVVQGGDPRGDGEGGPGYAIRDELNQRPYLRGTVGMALDWADTGGSQFFIMHSPAPHLDARYTVFGQVVNGMEVVDRIVPWDVIRRIRIRDGVSPE
jgi:cyclophilin family peptidyl-prolyl cis-trans isomerase/HEAT repeat protein